MIQGAYYLLGKTAILPFLSFIGGGENIFLLLLVDLIRSFSRNFIFYSFMFKHKISTQVVYVNSMSKHPLSVSNEKYGTGFAHTHSPGSNSTCFPSLWSLIPGYFVLSLHSNWVTFKLVVFADYR